MLNVIVTTHMTYLSFSVVDGSTLSIGYVLKDGEVVLNYSEAFVGLRYICTLSYDGGLEIIFCC